MKVLLPVDGSEPSMNTLHWASTIFNKESTQFYLLAVVPKTVPELSAEEYEIEDALRILKEAETELLNKGFKIVKAEYTVGDPAESICEYADEEKVDQIVIGSHGRTGLGKFLLGSVSSAVFEHSKQPVFIFKNKEAQKINA